MTEMDTDILQGAVVLFRAVIQQAISDATLGIFGQGRGRRRKGAPSSARLAHQQDARAWLLGMSKDFHTVCECAMLEPEAVKAAALETIAVFDRAYPHLSVVSNRSVVANRVVEGRRGMAEHNLESSFGGAENGFSVPKLVGEGDEQSVSH